MNQTSDTTKQQTDQEQAGQEQQGQDKDLEGQQGRTPPPSGAEVGRQPGHGQKDRSETLPEGQSADPSGGQSRQD